MTTTTPTAPPKTKLQLNDDGTITVPLRKRNPVVLDEPGALQLAGFYKLLAEVDAAHPIPTVGMRPPDDASRAELEQYAKDLQGVIEAQKQRTIEVYSVGENGEPPPYLAVFHKMVSDLAPEGVAVALDDLYGWAANPAACRELVNHFTAPLGGQATE